MNPMKLKDRVMDAARNVPTNSGDKNDEKKGALSMWRPAAYHGNGKNKNYFEGWYFKLVDASQKNVFALIPGVFLTHRSDDSYGFIQILEGRMYFSTYHRYPISDFEASSKELHIRIGPNIFRSDILGDIVKL